MKWSRILAGSLWLSLMIMAIIFEDVSFRIPYIIACLALFLENWTDAFSEN